MHFHLDHRTAEDIFKYTVLLAKEYCPEWTKDWPDDPQQIATDDFRVVVLKLFSELSETIIEQLNNVPYKYMVAFLDLMGVSPLPAEPARVPLSFKIAEGARSAYVPLHTQVASSENGDIVFETQEDLSVFYSPVAQIISLNPWHGKFTQHSLQLEEQQQGFYVFGKDDKEQFISYRMYLGDPLIFSSEKPGNVTIRITGSAKDFAAYFAIWKDNSGKIYEPQTSLQKDDFVVVFENIGPLPKSTVNCEDNYWISVEPDLSEVEIHDKAILPSISKISASLEIEDLVPEAVFINNSSVEAEKGFYPFGETPKKLDTCYIASQNFAKTDAQITFFFDLQEQLLHINPSTYQITDKDIKDLALLQKRFASESVIWEHLQSMLSEELQTQITEPDVEMTNIVVAFNTWINSNLIYDKDAFSGSILSQESVNYIHKKDLKGEELQRANRLLLEDIFPTELQKHFIVDLVWEYWDGEKWMDFNQENASDEEQDKEKVPPEEEELQNAREFEDEFLQVDKDDKKKEVAFIDNTSGLTKTGNVTFRCPQMQAMEINGLNSYWIRVRIEKGTYGIAGGYSKSRDIFDILEGQDEIVDLLIKEGITGGVRYQIPEYTPPFIARVTMNIIYREKTFSSIQSYSNFTYSPCDQQNSFQPYQAVTGENPSLYIGFDKNVGGISYSVYFSKREIYNEEDVREVTKNSSHKKDIPSTVVNWKYYDGQSWKLLEVENGNSLFGSGEISKFFIPQNIQPSQKFGKKLYFIKIEVEGNRVLSPYIKGIHFNTVWAKNSVTITNEILGSSNYTPNLKFQLTHTPVLKDQQIIVHESQLVVSEERKLLLREEGKDAIFFDNGKTWVRWCKVRDFSASTSVSRHYTLNNQDGVITFGDGINGMIPPVGQNNIVARFYSSGGGKSGNVPAQTISSLTTNIANIDSVNNYAASSGGNDQESLEDAVRRGPQTIKSKDRVVTKEDYEWLAQMASQEVAKAKYITSNRGEVTIAIVPSAKDEIYPKKALIDTVQRYLQQRALLSITDGIKVIGPQYQKINILVEIVPKSISNIAQIEEKTLRLLSSFLHPTQGGIDNKGWDFGARILIADIVKIINSIDNIVSIKKIRIEKMQGNKVVEAAYGTNRGWVALTMNTLPVVGNITVIGGGR